MKKAKSDNAYLFWSVSIVICALLAFFALIYASISSNKSQPESTDAAAVSDNAQTSASPAVSGDANNSSAPSASAPSATVLAESSDMGQGYIDSLFFLGDSTTNGLAHYNVIPKERVWTPASGTLTLNLWSTATVVMADGSEVSIKDAAAAKKPEYLVITLGVNGVSFLDEQTFKTEYTNLVKAVQAASPSTKIILNSIYPVTSAYPESSGITNSKINAANVWIHSIAESCGVAYAESSSVLKDENGALPQALCNGDNIHLNTDGYNKVIDYLRTHGWK